MEYVILEKNVIIDGIDVGNFVEILDVTNNIANVRMANTELIHNVSINAFGTTDSIKCYFTIYQTGE